MHGRYSRWQGSISVATEAAKEMHTPLVISKKGKADLRYGLYQAALVASSTNRHFIKYFTQSCERQRTGERDRYQDESKALREDACDCMDLMKKKEVFDPGYLKK